MAANRSSLRENPHCLSSRARLPSCSSFFTVRLNFLSSRSSSRRPSSTASQVLLRVDEVADLVPRAARDDRGQPVAGRGLVRRRQDLDDVAARQRRAQRRQLAVDPRAHAPVAHVRVHPVGEVDRRGAPREGEDLALRGERVDLVGIEVDLQGRQELLRVGDLALPVDELPQPLEAGVVGVGAEAALLVLPVRRDAALGDQVHLARADLDLEGLARFAHDRRVQRLVEVGLGHRDVVLDPPGHGPPELVDHAERLVAVARLRDDDAEARGCRRAAPTSTPVRFIFCQIE